MLYIYCPHCQEKRSEEEFSPAGQADIKRPIDPDKCSDKQWGEFLYFRKNTLGVHHEMWVHQAGCRKYFNIKRDTRNYEIYESEKIEKPTTEEIL